MKTHDPAENRISSVADDRCSPDDARERAREKERTRARNAAYRILTARPRSAQEVESKLRDRGYGSDVVSAVMADLVRLGFVNDRVFAGQWAAARMRLSGFGRKRIEWELRAKGVDGSVIGEVLDRLFEESPEAALALKAAGRKLETLARFDPVVRRRRLAGFLERKGFSTGIIRTILRSVT